MKKVILTFVVLLTTITASAYDAKIDGIYYNLVEKGQVAEVTTGDKKYTGELNIPATVKYEGTVYTVVINQGALEGQDQFTSLILPEGMTEIKRRTFHDCSSMKTVVLPQSITIIDEMAFQNCASLESISLPDGLQTIGKNAFAGCRSLVEFVIPNSVESVGEGLLVSCNSLKSATLSNKMTTIPVEMFEDCSRLASIHIPSNIKTIEARAFQNCEKLETVSFAEGVKSIGEYAFLDCGSLKELSLPESLETIKEMAISYCESLSKIRLPEGITTIEWNAITHCNSLVSINIPKSVPVVSYINYCHGLPSVDFPEGITTISGFTESYAITSIELPSTVESIYGFDGCHALKKIKLNEGLQSMGGFIDCDNLTSLTIPNSVTSITYRALKGCLKLKKVKIGEGVKEIGSEAFNNCKELKDVYCYAENVPTSKSWFTGSYIEYATLHVPESAMAAYSSTAPWSGFGNIVAIGEDDPGEEEEEEQVHYDADFYVDDIGYDYYDDYLDPSGFNQKAVLLSDGNHFTGKELVMPLKVENEGTEYLVVGTGKRAFMWNNHIEKVVLSEVFQTIGMESFEGCENLKTIQFPNSFREIGRAAFKGCIRLENVTLPNKVQVLRCEAFSGCSNMTKFTFPLSLETLESYKLLADCSSLEEVRIPLGSYYSVYGDSIVKGNYASRSNFFTKTFINCRNLKVAELCGKGWRAGNSEFYMDHAFDGCVSLEKIRVVDDDPPVINDAFTDEQYNTIVIVVPSGRVDAYSQAKGWKLFKHFTTVGEDMTTGDSGDCGMGVSYNFDKKSGLLTIAGSGDTYNYSFSYGNTPWYAYREMVHSVSIGNNVTAIGEGLFKDCSNMTTVTIPSSVAKIGMYAFENCSSLRAVDIPEGVTVLNNSLFAGCSSLKEIVIPKSVTTIGNLVFSGCTGMTSLTCLNPTPPTCNGYNGLGVDYSIPLYVPEGSSLKYKAAEHWRNFVIIREIAEEGSDGIWLTINDGAHGSMSLKIDTELPYLTLRFTPEDGWYIYSVMLDEEDVTAELSEDGTYTTPAITANSRLSVIYADSSTGMAKVQSDTRYEVRPTTNGLSLGGLSAGDRISVYTPNGQCVYNAQATGSQTEIPLTLHQVYIVKVNNQTLKVCL